MTRPILPRHIAMADQYTAAVTDAYRRVAALATAQRIPLHEATGNPWISAQVRMLITAIASGRARCCPHLARFTVIHAAAWAPARLVCSPCIAELTPGPVEDTACDRCRRPADPIYGGTVAIGPLLLRYGLCQRCARRTGLSHPDATHQPPAVSGTPANS